ncbi:RNA-directed DNA polymerase, eukaryota, reverse transcriptase zinc-binding domain protein [Tanacetum coccineum]
MSFGGRLTLVKSVLGSLPLYYFSMFHVPLSVIKCLERIRWGGVGEGKKLSWVKWDSVIASQGLGGLNIGSLRAKNLALLGKWWWRFRKEGDGLWVRVIKSIHGDCGGLGGVLGDGRDIRFWVDRWVDNRRLCDIFSRLYHLDRRKMMVVRRISGTVGKRVIVVVESELDMWRWVQVEDGVFKVKELTRLVEEKILHVESGGQETISNKLVPKKVNIFVWRALKGRLSVRVELDRRGIDLDLVLCPSCNNMVESCAHSLVTCDLAMSVWEKVFSWWKVGIVNAFSIDEFFSSLGNVNVPGTLARVWQAVIWTSRYLIWKERNARVFDNKISSTNKIMQDIQLKSFEWIVRRSKKYKEIDWQQWMYDPLKCRIHKYFWPLWIDSDGAWVLEVPFSAGSFVLGSLGSLSPQSSCLRSGDAFILKISIYQRKTLNHFKLASMESISQQNVNDLESKPKGWMTRVWSWYMSQNGNWLEKQRGILILATTMVAVISFYSALHPPGGTFTDSRNGPLGNAVQTEVVIVEYLYGTSFVCGCSI